MFSSRHVRSGGWWLSRWYARLSAIRSRTWLIILSSVFLFLVVMNLAYTSTSQTPLSSLQSYLPLPVAAHDSPELKSPIKPPVPPPVINAAPPVPTTRHSHTHHASARPVEALTLNASSSNQWKQPASERLRSSVRQRLQPRSLRCACSPPPPLPASCATTTR